MKYVKTRAAQSIQQQKAEEGRQQLQNYLSSGKARCIPHLQAHVLIFRKNRCAQRIRVER